MSAYLKLDNVKGEARAAGYAGWIEVASVQIGPSGRVVSGTSGSVGRPDAAASARDLYFTARIGLHSAELARRAVDGRSMNGELAMLGPGGALQYTVKLADAIVTSYQTGSHSGEMNALESFGLQTQSPPKYVLSTAAVLAGRWLVTIGAWTGYFVFEANGIVYWTERNGSGRHNGQWKATAADVQWKFATAGDIRTFVIPVPITADKIGGRILPVGQGFFTMQRA